MFFSLALKDKVIFVDSFFKTKSVGIFFFFWDLLHNMLHVNGKMGQKLDENKNLHGIDCFSIKWLFFTKEGLPSDYPLRPTFIEFQESRFS